LTSKLHSGAASAHVAKTAKNTIPSSYNSTLERNNSIGSFYPNNKLDINLRRNFDEIKRDTNHSSNALNKRRENQMR